MSERGLAPSGCSRATATESPLRAVGTASVKTSGSPFGIVAAPDGHWAFAVTGGGPGLAAASSVEVAVSPDSQFVFVTLEDDAEAAVFNLATALAHGFGAADYVGAVPLGQAPVGMAVSPDGRWLYATSESATAGRHPAGLSQTGSNGCGAGVPGTTPNEPPGTLTVIDLRRA